MKHISTNYVFATALILGADINIPVPVGSTCLSEQHSVQSEVPCCVTPPTVPERTIFDGDTIDLRRYDQRERMDREIMSFAYVYSTTMPMLKCTNRYFLTIEPLSKASDIPDSFEYLMVIKSNLSPIARSPTGAAGLQQFIPATAHEFGLEVNDNIGERYHVEEATAAVYRYFKRTYAKYDDWMAVSTTYNAGQERISSQLGKQLTDHTMDLWLVEETSRYMFRLLAMKEVFGDPQHFGFLLKQEHLCPVIPYKEVTVNTEISDLSDFAQKQGVTYAQLRDANPWLRDSSLRSKTGKRYAIRIPTQEGMNYDPKKTIPHEQKWIID